MSFKNFALTSELLLALKELGYTIPTPIQLQAIPEILSGNDVMALAQTGTGKTAAFTVPMLHLLNAKHDATKTMRQVRALVLTPTRELAAQVGQSVRNYGVHLKLRSEIVFGGVNITPQIKKLQRGTDIIIATPGRLIDLIDQQEVTLSKVEIFVLDEADRMLDMGFIKDVKKIIALLPKKRQNMLFSATLSKDIQQLAKSILHNHKLIEVANRNIATDLVTQVVYHVDQKRKRELLSFLIGSNNWKQVLVFTRTKHHANKLCEQLIADGLSAAALHGNKSQGARTRALEEFKTGKTRILVATDIAARGIDIEQLPYVINFELPNVAEDYVHRIGRTGRAGNPGNAISLVCMDELHLLRDIEKLTKKTISKDVIAGFEPDVNIRAGSQKERVSKFNSRNKSHTRSGELLHKKTSSRTRPTKNERAKPARASSGERSKPVSAASNDRRNARHTSFKARRKSRDRSKELDD